MLDKHTRKNRTQRMRNSPHTFFRTHHRIGMHSFTLGRIPHLLRRFGGHTSPGVEPATPYILSLQVGRRQEA